MSFKSTKKHIHIQPDEHIEMVVRKHWIMLLRDIVGVLFVGLLLIFAFASATSTQDVSPVATFVITLMMLVIWVIIFTLWTDYYLDMWIVTDKRVINIDQISLFNREISTLRVERIQDVVVKKEGILQELFDYGTLRVQSAGTSNDFSVIKGIPNPSYVQHAILERVDLVTENKNKITYNTKQRDTHSV